MWVVAFGGMVRCPPNDFKFFFHTVYCIMKAVISGVVRNALNQTVLNGLKDSVEKIFLDIFRRRKKF